MPTPQLLAWFTRYGNPEVHTMTLEDLAENQNYLEWAGSAEFDQWGCFSRAEWVDTAQEVPDEVIEAEQERLKAEGREAREEREKNPIAPYFTAYITCVAETTTHRAPWHGQQAEVAGSRSAEKLRERYAAFGDHLEIRTSMTHLADWEMD